MRARIRKGWLAVPLLLGASCQTIAGLDGKVFDLPPDATGGSGVAGATAIGGSSTAGVGLGASGRAGGGAGSPGGSSSGGRTDPGSVDDGGGGGEGGESGDGGEVGCADVAAELCMRPTWPGGVVPFVIDSESELVAASLRAALAAWEGTPIGSTVLRFVEETVPNARTMLLTLDSGCRPTSITDEVVTVAMGDCPGSLEMSHAVGVTLGLPSMHRRADRDRYLEMADPSDFACEKGTFFERCADRGDIPARLGPFDFGSVMFERSATLESCELEPTLARLYLARGEFDDPIDACRWVAGTVSSGGATHRGALAELYATSEGWRPFELVGVERGDHRPLESCLEATASFRAAPVLVPTGNARLAAFALGGEPIALFLNENDGDRWGAWRRLLPALPLAGFAHGLAAAAREGSATVDVVVMDAREIFHLGYDLTERRSDGWTSLGAPPADALSGLAVAPGETGEIFVYTYARRFESGSGGVYTREFNGNAWGGWQALPPLGIPAESDVSSLAATSVDGAQHVIAATGSGLRHIFRSSGTWSEWHAVRPPELEHAPETPHTVALVSNARHRLGVLGVTNGETLWFFGCGALPCTGSDAWSMPLVIGMGSRISAAVSTPTRIDVVTLLSEHRPPTQEALCWDGMWHKRWVDPG